MAYVRKRTPAIHRARQFLVDLIETRRAAGKTRLPPIGKMSLSSRFSTTTLSRALRELKRQGVVTVVQRKGIRISEAGHPAQQAAVDSTPDLAKPLPRWQAIKESLSRDILAGKYPPGALLPTIKEFCQKYGAGFDTMRKALLSLQVEEKLETYKRGFRVFDPPANSSLSTLILVAGERPRKSDIDAGNPRHPEFLRILERECLRLNIALEIHGYEDYVGDKARRKHSYQTTQTGVVLGHIVWVSRFSFEHLQVLVANLRENRVPVSLLDEDGILPLMSILGTNRNCRIFSVANSQTAGSALGNCLLKLGHHRIAYFSPINRALYCRNRIDSIERLFRKEGLAEAVVRFTLNDHELFAEIADGMRSSPPFELLDRRLRLFRESVGQSGLDDPFYRFYPETYIVRSAIQVVMYPLFDRALRDPSITAWVCVNDWVALVAMGYLRQKGVDVPDDIALFGFDDTFEAFTHGLTSYNFNMPALVTAMLDFVLRFPLRRRQKQIEPVEIPGTIMMRNSARKSGVVLGRSATTRSVEV